MVMTYRPVFLTALFLIFISAPGCGEGVEQVSGPSGNVTVAWDAPTTNAPPNEALPLDLSGYRVYYGRTSGTYSDVRNVAGATTTQSTIDGLSPERWYFAITAYNSLGVESVKSSEISTVVTVSTP